MYVCIKREMDNIKSVCIKQVYVYVRVYVSVIIADAVCENLLLAIIVTLQRYSNHISSAALQHKSI